MAHGWGLTGMGPDGPWKMSNLQEEAFGPTLPHVTSESTQFREFREFRGSGVRSRIRLA